MTVKDADEKLFLLFIGIIMGGVLSFLGNLSANWIWNYFWSEESVKKEIGVYSVYGFVFVIIFYLIIVVHLWKQWKKREIKV